MGGKAYDVHPNTSILPTGWANDPILAEETRAKMVELRRSGFSVTQIARRVGCSDRTVSRTLSPTKVGVHRCGAKRTSYRGTCQALVLDTYKHCAVHRSHNEERQS